MGKGGKRTGPNRDIVEGAIGGTKPFSKAKGKLIYPELALMNEEKDNHYVFFTVKPRKRGGKRGERKMQV